MAVDDKTPTYIFTLAKISEGIQALVSVAKINPQCFFTTMKKYADFLRHKNRNLRSSRYTGTRENDGLLGWRFGDCHANRTGRVGAPERNHVHYEDGMWRNDCPEKGGIGHLILASDEFIVWPRPVFKALKTFKQSGYGTNINNDNLQRYLGMV